MFIYRNGTINDKEALKQLGVIAFGQFAATLGNEHWTMMKSRLDDDDQMADLIGKAATYVCCDGHKIVGMAFLVPSGNPTEMFDAGWCYIRLVSVLPEYEGRGIGKFLTEMCVEHAIQTGETTIALHTSEFQDAARHIYERMGFTILRELEKRYNKQFWIYTMDLNNKK